MVGGVNVKPRLGFWWQLVWDMEYNTQDKEEESSRFEGSRIWERRGVLGGYKLVTAPKHCIKWLAEEKK